MAYQIDPLLRFNRAFQIIKSGCWIWLASRKGSYGQFSINQQKGTAHRASWIIHKGPIPHGLNVCHKCDKPLCVNPDHLFLGTQSANIKDMYSKGRGADIKGTKNGQSVLTEEQVYKVRSFVKDGKTYQLVADTFKVSVDTIHKIVTRKTWKHI